MSVDFSGSRKRLTLMSRKLEETIKTPEQRNTKRKSDTLL